MKKVLPINDKPTLRSLTPHLNICSICESYITEGEPVADLDVLSCDDMKDWVISSLSLCLQVNKNNIRAFCDKYDKNMECVLYKECKLGEELIIRINSQAYAYACSNISITIGSKPVTLKRKHKTGIELGNFSKGGVFTYRDDNYLSVKENVKNGYPIYLRIQSDVEKVCVSTSIDGKVWKIQNEYYECIDTKDILYMSIFVGIDENQWYNWYFTNYILLKCAPDSSGVHMDHFNALSKNFKYHNLNMFLDYSKIDKDIVLGSFGDISNFIRTFIDKDYYIELFLNERYISGRLSNKAGYNRNHSNLVYGYDDFSESFMIMGLDEYGQAFNIKVKYNEFEESFKNAYGNDEIVVEKYNPDTNMFKLNIDIMKKYLEDYLNGYNSTRECGFLVQPTDEVFGMKIYDTYLSKRYFSVFLSDRRISYVLYEHHVIMNERIDFLLKRGVLSDARAHELKICTGEMVNISHKIVLLVVKWIMKNEFKDRCKLSEIEVKIHTLLSELKGKEKKFIIQLLEFFEEYLKET